MKQGAVISFISGLVISAMVLGLVFLVFLFLTFNLGGGETLYDIQVQAIVLLIFTVAIAIISAAIARQLFKTGKKPMAWGISVLPVLVTLCVAVWCFSRLNYGTAFDKTTWVQSRWKPFNMTATLVQQHKLIGLTKFEVKEMLGEPDEEREHGGKGAISYLVKDSWTLILYFKNDKVVETQLRLPYLGV